MFPLDQVAGTTHIIQTPQQLNKVSSDFRKYRKRGFKYADRVLRMVPSFMIKVLIFMNNQLNRIEEKGITLS